MGVKEFLDNNHIFPFLWVHGEPHADIRKEIEKIYECGIRMFCVESRPHPDFCGDKWWEDFSYILSVAEELGMRVWLLDDKHFPTGFANDSISKYPHLKQKHIYAWNVDFYSEGNPARFVLPHIEENNKLISALVYKRKGDGIDVKSGIDVTDGVFKDNLAVCVKKGFYRIVAVYSTTNYSELDNYIDMLNPESAYLQIKEVYEPHYERYKDKFGKVFMGFFSDEPRFSNGRVNDNWVMKSMYRTTLGLVGAAYPYREDMFELLDMQSATEWAGLWYDDGKITADFRLRYMDLVTRLYEQNFSQKIGQWCGERGVEYTGHVTEDMGNHTRLGSGTGHFFRSMSGQTMSGIDVVLHQITPFFKDVKHIYPVPELYDDTDFFHFTLATLGASAAHLEPQKSNRAMCEIFGAYGWGESINTMKWLIDFMLVRGINYFVPHAFNPKYNDLDCPPYFWYNGENPMYSAFKELMTYTERLCRELSEDYYVDVAVLYHSEAEWSGKPFKPCDGVCRILAQNQIPYEIVPSEYLNVTKAKILIIPPCEYLGVDAEEKISGFKGEIIRLKTISNRLVSQIDEKIRREYRLKNSDKNVRVLKRGEKFFIFNEGLKTVKNAVLQNGKEYEFTLISGQSRLIDVQNFQKETPLKLVKKLSDKCKVMQKDCTENGYSLVGNGSYRDDFYAYSGKETFAGKVKYSLEFNCQIKDGERYYLDFGSVNGGLKVTLNGKKYPELFGVPYLLEVTDALKNGVNELSLELSSTLALRERDMFSRYCRIDKLGLNQSVKLMVK